MDPVTVKSLVGTCASIAAKVLATIRDLGELVKALNAERSAAMLSAQLRMLNATVSQLKQWLNMATVTSESMRETMNSALGSCHEIVAEIEDHVRRTPPRSESGRRPSTSTVGMLWDERTIEDYDRMLGTQFQTCNLLIQLLGLEDEDMQDMLLDSSSNIRLLYQGARDAQTIRTRVATRKTTAEPEPEPEPDDADLQRVAENELLRGPTSPAEAPALTRAAMKSVDRGGAPSLAETGPSTTRRPSDTGSFSVASSIVKPTTDNSKGKATKGFSLNPLKGRKGTSSGVSRKVLFANLCQASREGDVEWAQSQLNEGAKVNGLDERSFSPLHYAVMRGHLDVVKLLVDRGANINGLDGQSSAMIFFAIRKNHFDVLHYLLENGAVVNALVCDSRDRSYRRTPLSLAVENGQLEAVRVLLEHGANMHDVDARGLNPLCSAVNRQHISVVQTLLGAGARIDANVSRADWATEIAPLHVAAHRGHADIVEILLTAGANIGVTCRRGKLAGITALHLARGDSAEILLQHGGKIFARDSLGQFPLSWAASTRDVAAVRANLAHKAPVNAQDSAGDTALQAACRVFAHDVATINNVEQMGDSLAIASDLVVAGASEPTKMAARRLMLEQCQRFVRNRDDDIKPHLLPLLDLMKFLADCAAEYAETMISIPSGVRDMPRGFIAETRLAQLVTR